MARNAYLAVARLSTHPAWVHSVAALVCPVCKATYHRVTDYDRDFLGHKPDAEEAWRWLSGKVYEREAGRRGWPSSDAVLLQESEECGCGRRDWHDIT